MDRGTQHFSPPRLHGIGLSGTLARATLPTMKRSTSPELLVPLQPSADVSLRLQLERGLRHAIQSGRLPAGAPLPSTRVLAADLGISRGVVIGAYEQLLAEGYVDARRGSATRVARRRPEPSSAVTVPSQVAQAFRYDFRPGMPDLSLFPRPVWLSSMRRTLAAASHLALDYPDPRGMLPARTALAEYLNRVRATLTQADRIVLCSGVAQGLRLVSEVLRARGLRSLAVEDPGYANQHVDTAAHHLEKIPIPVDADGLRIDLLEGTRAGAVVVTPAHQHPTGAVLAPQRRSALLDWAIRRRAIIIEDDYDAEYRYDREPIGSLQGLAPEHVVYMGTASKVLSPALRLAWMALPADLVEGIAHAKLLADRGSPALDQLALADFLNRGELDRHLRRTRQIYRGRRDSLIAALGMHLPELRPQGIAAGLHLMIDLDPGADEESIVAAAAKRSIRLLGVGPHRSVPEAGPPALLLGYGGLPESVIPEAVGRLASLLHEQVRLER
jgi:GntR family transcriptional regulator/MocR family aminotransferase